MRDNPLCFTGHGRGLTLTINCLASFLVLWRDSSASPRSRHSIDFFVVPTATFRVLFVFVVLSHARRRVLHFQVTDHPSQDWTMQQIREAFPWDQGCRYLLRDRDAIYGDDWVEMTKGLGMEEVITAPRSPWQNPYVERLIGSIRCECLDHVTAPMHSI